MSIRSTMTTRIQPLTKGEYRNDKKRDCAVRALSNVTLLEYEEAEEILSKYGREHNKGTYDKTLVAALFEVGLTNVTLFGNSQRTQSFSKKIPPEHLVECHKGQTLGKFLEEKPKGRLFVIYSGHAFAVIDGNVIDTVTLVANRRIIAVFKANAVL